MPWARSSAFVSASPIVRPASVRVARGRGSRSGFIARIPLRRPAIAPSLTSSGSVEATVTSASAALTACRTADQSSASTAAS